MKIKNIVTIITGIFFVSTAPLSFAVGAFNPTYNWQYQTSYTASTGVPSPMTTLTLPAGSGTVANIATRMMTLLPNTIDVSTNPVTANLLANANANDLSSNIILKANANVKITFMSDLGSLANSVGYFPFPASGISTFTKTQLFAAEKIVFPFARATVNGGYMTAGNTVDLGTFTAGTGLGFLLAANGYGHGYVDPYTTSGVVNASQPANAIFTTIKALNPEPTVDKQAHFILVSDNSTQMLILGMEDINRAGPSYNPYWWQPTGFPSDNDFNDVIIGIQVTPWSAVDLTNIKTISGGSQQTFTGVSGPVNWREVTSAPAVTDPIKAAGQEIMKAKNATAP